MPSIQDEYEALTREGFGQERLGIWAGQTKEALFPLDAWTDTTRDAGDPYRGDYPRLVFEVAPDRSSSAICVAWRVGGRPHVRLAQWNIGDGWLVDTLTQLATGWGVPVHYDDTGPARDIASLLVAAGVPVRTLRTHDVTAASAGLLSGIRNRTVTHHPDELLDASAAGATARTVGQAWAIDRRGDVPAAAILAAALAIWALVDEPDPVPFEIL